MGTGAVGGIDGRVVGGRETGGLGGTREAAVEGVGGAGGAVWALILAELGARGFGLLP